MKTWSVLVSLALAANVTATTVPAEIDAAVKHGAELIVSMQESLDASVDVKAEWPYEGVYRVRGRIPIGYRIGGTSIAASAVILSPGYTDDPKMVEAIARATKFVIEQREHRLMTPPSRGSRYDVRGWGYTYALRYLLLARQLGVIPDDMKDEADVAIRWYIDAIELTENRNGGWNYASTSTVSPFMTGPTLQALFDAKSVGFDVDGEVVTRALEALESARSSYGSFEYSGPASDDRPDGVPGAAGRMMVAETTLYLAGRSTTARIRGAIDAFIVHWEWFDKRRSQHGTHVPPYGIAPYYFYFAHYCAAQAVEQLPDRDRREYRRRLNDLLFKNRIPSEQDGGGGWNDRVFPRSANYGTSMAILALTMPDAPRPARWNSDEKMEKAE